MRASGPSEAELIFAKAARQRGWTFTMIGDHLKRSPDVVADWLRPKGAREFCRGEARSRVCGKGLRDDDVRAIRRAEGTYKAIGERYGISAPMVCHIKQRVRWAHVSDEGAA